MSAKSLNCSLKNKLSTKFLNLIWSILKLRHFVDFVVIMHINSFRPLKYQSVSIFLTPRLDLLNASQCIGV